MEAYIIFHKGCLSKTWHCPSFGHVYFIAVSKKISTAMGLGIASHDGANYYRTGQ